MPTPIQEIDMHPRFIASRRLACGAAIAAALAAVAGCASRTEVRRDRDPAANLHAYRTFAFYEPLSVDGSRYSTLLGTRLKQATRAQLERSGYAYSEREPDLRVNLFLAVRERQELRSAAGAHGWYRGLGHGSETVAYRQGTLAIDLVDARRRVLVWQGVAEGRIDREAAESPGRVIDDVVGEIFAGFPRHDASAR
jgi:hypothetical protein